MDKQVPNIQSKLEPEEIQFLLDLLRKVPIQGTIETIPSLLEKVASIMGKLEKQLQEK